MNDANVPGLPQDLKDIATKLIGYGYTLEKDTSGIWIVRLPAGDRSGFSRVAFQQQELGQGLLRMLRREEEMRDVLHRYEQNDARWKTKVYGSARNDTTIGEAGCGPTSLAMVLQYLMNNGSRPRYACYAVSPPQTAAYAAMHGRVSGRGTDANKMIMGIKDKWPEFAGTKVSFTEAAQLVGEGRLVIFLSHGCAGYSFKQPLHRAPDVHYAAHYMILAGVEGPVGPDQIFYVVDGGRRAERSMRFIKQSELQRHAAGFWWVYRRGEPAERSSQ